MELFDKNHVYLEWSDNLKEKECILAKTYQDLKDFVNSGDEGRICNKVKKGNNKPFTNDLCECDFCYYDPNYKIKKAFFEGKKIQWKYKRDCTWNDYCLKSLPCYEDSLCEWRIKPTIYFLSIIKIDYQICVSISDKKSDYDIYCGDKNKCNYLMDIICKIIRDKECYSCTKNCHNCKKILDVILNKPSVKNTRRMTNRELAEWLAKGNGEMQIVNGGLCFSHLSYADKKRDEKIDETIKIRKFGSNKWEEPLIEE